MKSEKWYENQLNEYFLRNYGEYEDEIAWFTNPDINTWRGYIEELGIYITLNCDDDGNITEEVDLTEDSLDKIYDILKHEFESIDALYEDYIIRLVTMDGFKALRRHKLLESCGSVNGRNLYTLIQ